ncbi:MAG: HAMP domain-containing protein, partial [Anaerolineae bacterium]
MDNGPASPPERRFLWAAHPAQAVLEAWLIGLAILFLLSLQVGAVSPVVLSNGLLFLCGTSGLWAVLRCRLPQGPWPRQFAWEVAVGLVMSLAMAAGIILPAMALGWEAAWHESSLAPSDAIMLFLLLGIGPGYVVSRGGVRLWLAWDRLRRRRLLWAITHAHLTVVVLLILLVVGGGLLISVLSGGLAEPPPAGLAASLTERLLQTFFPATVLMFFLTGAALVVLLPPSALFSFLVARRTTRRLEALAEAAEALSQGHYDTRVEPRGEDEVARLQAGFNTMAGELERSRGDLEAERDKVAAR